MDQISTLYSLQVISDSDSDTEVSSVNTQTDATGLDHENTTSTLHRLQIIWDADNDIENSSLDKQTDATRSDHEQPSTTNADGSTKQTNQGGDESFTENTGQSDTSQSPGRDSNLEDGQQNDQQMGRNTDNVEQTQHAKEPSKETKGPGLGFIKILKQYFSINPANRTPTPPCETDPTTSHKFPNDQDDEMNWKLENIFEKDNEERDESSGENSDKTPDPSVSTETTEQEGEGQTLQTKQEQGEEEENAVFQEQVEPQINVVFIETSKGSAIEDLLKNCQKYKDELRMGEILTSAVEEYETLLKKAKETGCKKQNITPPPSELNSVNDKERNQAPLLYAVIAFVSEKVPSYKRWREAVSEFIILTTLSQSDPPSSQKKRSNSQSGYQNKSKPSAKSYNNNIEKLLDQDWGPDRAAGPSVYNDYRHLFTCESVLRSTFPEADIFSLVDSKIRGPEDVPPELQHKALFHFLLSFKRKKYGVEPSDAWRDFGRLVLAEKQLDLARKAQGPDLHQNVIVKKLDFYKMQNELKEKTEEVEELSTRLSKFASQQLTEGNPNIMDLSDTHRPTRLGEMYSQLFGDEWSEAFEAFKPKNEDEDDDIFPDTLYILHDLLTNIFDFCKDQSKSLEDSFALAIGLSVPQKGDAATETDNTLDSKDAPKLDEKEQTGSVGDKGSSPGRSIEEEQVKEQDRETGGEGESPVKEEENVEKETDKSTPETNRDTDTSNMEEKPSHVTQTEVGGESSQTLETDQGNTIPPTDKTESGTDKNVVGERQDKNPEECPKADEGNDVNIIDESAKLDENKGEQNTGDTGDNNGDQEIKNSGQGDKNQQTKKDTVGEEPSNETPIEKSQEVSEEGKTDTDKSDSSQKDPAQEPEKEDKQPESKDFRKSVIYPTIDRHARDFRKAAASTSAKTKSKLFIATELPALIADETVRADVRVLTYVRKCVELCWYMCMQDPPMTIISPKQGQLVDKALFSFHGRRGKIVEVCVWPALLLHDNGPLVCKGYVLPEERNRNR